MEIADSFYFLDDNNDDDDEEEEEEEEEVPWLLFGLSDSGAVLHKKERKQSNSSRSFGSSCNNVRSFVKQFESRINLRKMKSHFSALDLSNR